MKEGTRKNLIIVAYWALIGILVWFSRAREMPFMERIFSFLCFAVITIIISIFFSKTLFRKTLRSQKTVPFVIKFFAMVFCMAVSVAFMGELFCILEYKGFFPGKTYLEQRLPFFRQVGEAMPGLIASNVVFCVILLYYEYSLLQQTSLESQLKLLHAQINPHFMFNVLNYLHVLMQKDTELASTLLLKYSDVLRYQLYSGKRGKVKLDQEIQFMKDFIDVEKFRWEDKLDVKCTWIIDNPNGDIPPLLFIPFVENAFKHVSRSTDNKGHINLYFEQRNNQISFEVENSRTAKPVRKKDSGIGLENIKARLEILFGPHHLLTIKETDVLYQVKLKLYL